MLGLLQSWIGNLVRLARVVHDFLRRSAISAFGLAAGQITRAVRNAAISAAA